VHDYNLGIPPSGLFWTTAVGPGEVHFEADGRRATLDVRRMAVIDSFQFFAPTVQPAEVRMRVTWEATGDLVPRGAGSAAAPEAADAFLGEIAPASSCAELSGSQLGFAFESVEATTEAGGWGQVGTERNGTFL
jgi:hypothetical protein